MEGLEISIISLSELQEEHRRLRLDAEYLKKEYIRLQKSITSNKYFRLSDKCFITDGIHQSISFCDKSRINLISAKSPKANYFDLSSNGFISEEQHNLNPRTALKKDDVIVSTVGTIGNCAVVNEDILPANCDRDVGIIRILNEIRPYFLSTFLLSKYGRYQTFRESTGNVQLHLFIYKIKELIVPDLTSNFQNSIENLCKLSFNLLSKSKKLYSEAESLLLDTLGFHDFHMSTDNVSIKSFKDSFLTTGRLDAEYYQKKYEDYEQFILKYPNGHSTLNELCQLKDKNFTPLKAEWYQYIELSHVDSSGNVNDTEKLSGETLPSRARRQVKTGDVLISSIEGSLANCAIVSKDLHNGLCSTGFYVINSTLINSETLLILFKSPLMQNLLKKSCSGTILTAINKSDFLAIPIPKINLETQTVISELVQESFKLKSESDRLLALAKQAVEVAIEKSEEEAMKLFKSL